jgi:fucose permease
MSEPISRKAEILTCVLYLFYIGEEVGFGSWIPTYAVVEKLTTPEGASILGSMFWVSNTLFRIVLLYVQGKISSRLKVLLAGMIGTSLLMLLCAIGGMKYFAAYAGVIFVGAFLASMFALFITLPGEFNFKVTNSNTANFMMCASMGEGALTMPIGYAMGLFGPNMLFVMMLIFSLIMYYVFNELMSTYEEDSKNRSPINERLIDDNESRTSEVMKPF